MVTLRRSREVDRLRSAGVTEVRNTRERVDQELDQERNEVIHRYSREVDHSGATVRAVGVMASTPAGRAVPRSRSEISLGVRGGTGRRCGWSCMMAQAAEQGGDHVLVPEEVQPVIVV